jgi:hypothetical protein
MSLFRSEAEVDAWCRAQRTLRGEVLTLEQVWALSQRWYGDRMRPEFRGHSIAGARAIFAQVGLRSAFWQEPSDG